MSLYLEAATILTAPNGSLKSRIYHQPVKSPPARLYALIVETLKHQAILNEVIENSGILGIEKKLTHPLALLLLHDHLLTRNGIATSSGPLKNAVLKHKARLSAEFTRARIRRGLGSTAALKEAADKEAAAKIPRWVRVNALKTTLSDVLKAGFAEYMEVAELKSLLDAAATAKNARVYYKDPIVENLLAFPPAIDLIAHPLYKSGALILQDRSSCLPAHLLDPPKGARTIDATAAPGNKTTHIAALLGDGNGGTVTAFEKDSRRAEVLKKMVSRAGGDAVITIKAGEDFLKADPKSEELRGVTHLLLDPSCSGSGIVSREEYSLIPLSDPAEKNGKKRKRSAAEKVKQKPLIVEEEQGEQEESRQDMEKSRLLALAEFQKGTILHAMKFPKARKITYSTCSIHAEENEDVVMGVLASAVARRRGWRVERREEGTLRGWERRGLLERCGGDEVVAQACVRCNPIEDGGIGFFVVAFVRDGDVDEEAEEVAEEGSKVQAEDNTVQKEAEEGEEWKGFSDGEVDTEAAEEKPQVQAESGEKQKKKKKRQKRK
ncbi:S-adenosyl-L-methionine-dependent methyltransferase [Sphaerosporella brunnea]|uniref:S-adenosyl-L-methionine-dependent methyltransferase n=1 Tax=Sphaerosporella brunnea TaxID=1250544 RepID=A0A5J5EGL1_9PEZI|nr:S-adenosyl-L-methionine-dependent methyltransferase [Sphaerosporella brunnea]